jgi:hypothetical protein
VSARRCGSARHRLDVDVVVAALGEPDPVACMRSRCEFRRGRRRLHAASTGYGARTNRSGVPTRGEGQRQAQAETPSLRSLHQADFHRISPADNGQAGRMVGPLLFDRARFPACRACWYWRRASSLANFAFQHPPASTRSRSTAAPIRRNGTGPLNGAVLQAAPRDRAANSHFDLVWCSAPGCAARADGRCPGTPPPSARACSRESQQQRTEARISRARSAISGVARRRFAGGGRQRASAGSAQAFSWASFPIVANGRLSRHDALRFVAPVARFARRAH